MMATSGEFARVRVDFSEKTKQVEVDSYDAVHELS